jgi:hypothetical protein
MKKTHFRFYSNQLGFLYFNDLDSIPKKLTEDEFSEGNLSLISNATVLQYLDMEVLTTHLYPDEWPKHRDPEDNY